MKFACPKCTTRYSISDEKVPADKTLRFTCKKCGNVFKLRRKPRSASPSRASVSAPAPAAAAAPAPAAMDGFQGATRVANVNEIMAVKKRSRTDGEVAVDDAPAAPPPATPFIQEEDWYALIGGKQLGPLTVASLREMVASARVTKRTYVWRDGMADWVRLQSCAPLSSLADEALEHPTPHSGPPPDQEAATVAVNMARLQEELKRIQKPARAAPESTDPLAALVGEPTGESALNRAEAEGAPLDAFAPYAGHNDKMSDPALAMNIDDASLGAGLPAANQRPGRRDEYYQAAPGEATRIFMATAGLYKRRRTQKVAAVAGVVFTVLFVTIIALDIAGVFTIPGMGLMYDVTGIEDPDPERAIARTEAKLQTENLSPEQRVALEKRRAAMRNKLLGGGPGPLAKAKSKGKGRRADPQQPDPEPEVGIKEANDVSKEEAELTRDIFADDRKPKSKAPTLRPPTEIQTPNLPDGLTQDSIFEVINKNQRAMSLCISQSMKEGEKLTGKMEVEMSIGANGMVRSAAIGTERFVGSTIGNCTVRTVRRWKFPAFNGQPVTVIFPYVLSAAF